MKKKLMTVLALVLVIAMSVAGTYAYLTDTTGPITNTFTVGNIDITLAETTTNFKMVPGCDIAKDPMVTVEANSEDCWLFVKIDESENLQQFISYAVANDWTQGDGTNIPATVWYRPVEASTADQTFSVLAGDQVTVKNNVTKTMMDGLKVDGAIQPTLTFTACAVQADGFATASAAYAEAPVAFKA
ncbi:MAG: TasA family protein [Oscillospiraceae bacterium]|nr:TasA family protein [Oscillospiraceae bacterium]